MIVEKIEKYGVTYYTGCVVRLKMSRDAELNENIKVTNLTCS
jgi:hypothetical protein